MAKLRSDRLISLRSRAGMSQSELAEASGVGQSTIARLEAGETREPRSARALAKALGCSIEYLFGETDDIPGDLPSAQKSRPVQPVHGDDPEMIELDEIDLRYGLGGTYIDGPVSTEKRKFPKAWLRHVSGTAPEHLFWAMGDGESMEPTIRSGEVMLIDRSQIAPRSGDGIWAIAYGEITMVKRLRPRPDGSIDILSDNQVVPTVNAVDGEMHVIGRVVAVVRRL